MNNALQILEIRSKKLIYKNIELMRKVAVITFLLLLFAFGACEQTSAEQETIAEQEETFFELQGEHGFVGTLDGTNAFVSILLGAEEGIAYMCNGEENISEWFSGPVDDLKEIHFTNSAGAKIRASFLDHAFKGEVTFKGGLAFPFSTTVNSGIDGGIYRVIDEEAEKAEIKAGWIIRSEEDQRGAIIFNSTTLTDMPLRKINFDDIKDGSSNTISIKGASFSIFRYKVKVSSPVPPIPIPYPNTG